MVDQMIKVSFHFVDYNILFPFMNVATWAPYVVLCKLFSTLQSIISHI